jgi:hypothetical protein
MLRASDILAFLTVILELTISVNYNKLKSLDLST